jgi:hypothetical protein
VPQEGIFAEICMRPAAVVEMAVKKALWNSDFEFWHVCDDNSV